MSTTQNSSRHVSFLNLTELYESHRKEFLAAIESVIEKSAFIGGTTVDTFEREFARWVSPGLTAVGCGNGTDALMIAARALSDDSPGEAILPSMTFFATAEAIIQAGYRVKLVDVEPGTWLIDPEQLRKNITAKTRLVVPVHLYGQMGDMEAITSIAQEKGSCVLEDAAQSHGALWKQKHVGFFGDAATFSFYPGKNLGAFGDGGAIISKDAAWVEKCSMMAKHGGLKKYEHQFVGLCSRLDAVQAAVLSVKLKYIDEWTEKRRQVATWYREYLSGLKGLTLPVENKNAKHVYHLYIVETKDRAGLKKHLEDNGIETGIHYPQALHQLPALKNYNLGQFPIAERIAAHGLSLPMCPTLKEEAIKYVAEMVRKFFKN